MKAWCPSCRLVDHVDAHWACLWCGTVTLERCNPAEGRVSNAFTISELRSMHARYACGETRRALARLHHTGRDTLKHNWWHIGLPTRSLLAANRLAAPRRRVHRVPRLENHAYRHDITDQDVIQAYDLAGSLRGAASALACSISTVHRRLHELGHARQPVGRNQHTRSHA